MKAAEQPRFPSRADVEARLRAQNPPPPVPSRETYRTEIATRADVYGALLERIADRALSAAEKRGDRSGVAALIPITLRLAKADASLALVGGVLGTSSFKDALAAVINARLAAMGKSTTANVEAELDGRRPLASVLLGVPPKKA